jgi:hypothetical protein
MRKLKIKLLIIFSLLTNLIYSQEIIFPKPFGIAIDDLGWMQGSSLGDEGGPWRAGVRRYMDVRDYKPIVEIGKAIGVRFQGIFVLSEMDRLNILTKYTTTTKQGEKWDNSENINKKQIEIMDYVKENAAYLEFGLHGVGHEHFDHGKRTRAEWYDIENNKPWDEQDSKEHLKAFSEIMAQYGLTKENGHSFPESYVPCAYAYYWNPNGEYSTGKLMHEYGVKYVNTLFEEIPECNPPIEFGGGFDHGVLVINRYNYGNPWYEFASLPKDSLPNYKTEIIETHWPNWLAQDDFLQPELNKRWIEFFRRVQKSNTHFLAKNTEQLFSQWLYKKYTNVVIRKNAVTIDNTNMPNVAYQEGLLGNMVLKVKLENNKHLSSANINGKPISGYFEECGYGFIYLPQLKKEKYELSLEFGNKSLDTYINTTGTYNVYDVDLTNHKMSFDIKMYGHQEVKIICDKPKDITCSNPYLKIKNWDYNQGNRTLSIELSGRDIQGEKGKISINFE